MKKAKFKIGDIVRVLYIDHMKGERLTDNILKTKGGCLFHEGMHKFSGKFYKIYKVNSFLPEAIYQLETEYGSGIGWFFSEEMIELSEMRVLCDDFHEKKKKTHKFNEELL